MLPRPLRRLREAAGLTQAELAGRAGVSRQLVSAVEAGRHLPRVDAALALAAALDADVGDLFAVPDAPVDVVSGERPAAGALLRAGRVGNRTVTALARVGEEGWEPADGLLDGARWAPFARLGPGIVVVGCEPGLELVERTLRERRRGALAVMASTASALAALEGGRAHAAVVHGPDLGALRPPRGLDLERFHLVRWRVGLAVAPGAGKSWWRDALAGRRPVVQRERGAGAQRAFERALEHAGGEVPGPRAQGHLEAARRAVLTGLPAVTIEPAARAVGADFHPLEEHSAELWVDARWGRDAVLADALEVISGAGFRRRLEGVGGYDLSGCGARAR